MFDEGLRARSEGTFETGFSLLLIGTDMISELKETLRLRIADGLEDSDNLLPTILFDASSISENVSCTGVDGDGLGGDNGPRQLFLSADTALFGPDTVEVGDVLLVLGEGQRFGPVDRVGDLYLEPTSLIRDRRFP